MTTAAQKIRPKQAPETIRRSKAQAAPAATPRYLKTSLKLGGLNDPQEHEAEHAARVVAAGGSYRVRDPGGSDSLRAEPVDPGASGRIKRKPAALPASADTDAAKRIESARAAVARPLPAPVRSRLEHGFGEKMSDVRVHTGPDAHAAAAAIGARAYTEGNRITLGHGESEHDLHLMAHEATHVVQNRAAAPKPAARRQASDTREPIRRNEAAPAAATTIRRFGLSLDSILEFFGDKANLIPGFRMFTIILGLNPVTMQAVERSPANILRAVVELMPLGGLIVQALDKYAVFEKAGAWVSQQIDTLHITGSAIADAVSSFLHSLHLGDVIHPGDVWDRAKKIFTEPIERIKTFIISLVEGVVAFIKDAVLHPLADLASRTAAWDLLVGILGKNPITGDEVPQNAEALIGGLLKLAGQDEIFENLKKSHGVARATAWFKGAVATLVAFVKQIPTLFLNALKSFVISDLLDLPGAIGRVLGLFGDFAGRFLSWAGDAAWSLLEIIFDVVSPGAFGYVKKTGAALKSILKNPLPFVGNLVKAAKLGLQSFSDNILTHLKAGLINWLTGALPGVYIPKAISLVEVGKFALSVLGISWAQIRGKIVKALGPSGEKIMAALETTFDVVVALAKGGPAAAWEVIKEKLTNLKDMVIDGITGFVIDTIVTKAIPKLVSLFIPGAGFISAIISIYGTITTFIAQLSKVAAAIEAFVDSIVAIAAGQIGGAANRVEQALAGVLSLAISLLAGFMGLGNVAGKVLALVEKVRTVVDRALDTAIAWIVGKAKALFSKKDPADPEKQAKVKAALQDIPALEGKHAKDGHLSRADADAVAAGMAGKYSVFSRFFVRTHRDRWIYGYAASPEQEASGDVPAQAQLTPEEITKCKIDAVQEIVEDASLPVGQMVEHFESVVGALKSSDQPMVKLATGQEALALSVASRNVGGKVPAASVVFPDTFRISLGTGDVTPADPRKNANYISKVGQTAVTRGFDDPPARNFFMKSAGSYGELGAALGAAGSEFGLSQTDMFAAVTYYTKSFDLLPSLRAKITTKAQGERLLGALSRLNMVYLAEMMRQDTSVADVAAVVNVSAQAPSKEAGLSTLTEAAPFTLAKGEGTYSTQELAYAARKSSGSPLSQKEEQYIGGAARQKNIIKSPQFQAYMKKVADLAQSAAEKAPNKDDILSSVAKMKNFIKASIKQAFGIGGGG